MVLLLYFFFFEDGSIINIHHHRIWSDIQWLPFHSTPYVIRCALHFWSNSLSMLIHAEIWCVDDTVSITIWTDSIHFRYICSSTIPMMECRSNELQSINQSMKSCVCWSDLIWSDLIWSCTETVACSQHRINWQPSPDIPPPPCCSVLTPVLILEQEPKIESFPRRGFLCEIIMCVVSQFFLGRIVLRLYCLPFLLFVCYFLSFGLAV